MKIKPADILKLIEKLKPVPKPELRFVMDKDDVDESEEGVTWVVLTV